MLTTWSPFFVAMLAGCGPSTAPNIKLVVEGVPPLRGLTEISVEVEGFTAEQIDFYIDSEAGEPLHFDVEAPFSWSLDTQSIADGEHIVVAVARSGELSLSARSTIKIRNRPNVVVVFVDDLDELQSPFLEAMPHTLERLAEAGLRFTQSFAPSPVCTPARAIALTGRYPHNTGVFDFTPPDGGHEVFRNTQEHDTIATRLQDGGYRNAYLGKYIYFAGDDDPTHVPPGWDEWFVVVRNQDAGFDYDANHNGQLVTYGSAPEDYQTDVLSGLARDFIVSTESDDDQPFMLFLAPAAPHVPLPPAPRHADHPWVDADLAAWPNFNEPDVSDKPTWLRDGMAELSLGHVYFNANDYRDRMGSLMALDDLIGDLFEELESTGELEQTVVFFASDNGYNFGAHRQMGKTVPYEESIRVPLFVAGRDIPVGTDARMVSHADFAPTILDLAGLPHHDLDGYSLVPLFSDDPTSWRTEQLLEYNSTGGGARGDHHTLQDVLDAMASGQTRVLVPSYRALRTENELFVEWYRGNVHEYELYDLAADPYQLDNLLATPAGELANAATTVALGARLAELMSCSGPSCR